MSTERAGVPSLRQEGRPNSPSMDCCCWWWWQCCCFCHKHRKLHVYQYSKYLDISAHVSYNRIQVPVQPATLPPPDILAPPILPPIIIPPPSPPSPTSPLPPTDPPPSPPTTDALE